MHESIYYNVIYGNVEREMIKSSKKRAEVQSITVSLCKRILNIMM